MSRQGFHRPLLVSGIHGLCRCHEESRASPWKRKEHFIHVDNESSSVFASHPSTTGQPVLCRADYYIGWKRGFGT